MNNFYTEENLITYWLDSRRITNYKLIPDDKYGFVVNVDSTVDLIGLDLKFIPVKFNVIDGNFTVKSNALTSLEFCPHNIKGSFSCSENNLKSLEHCPQIVEGFFNCEYNSLETLKFLPTNILFNVFYCGNNPALKDIQKINDFETILKYRNALELETKLNSNLDVKTVIEVKRKL